MHLAAEVQEGEFMVSKKEKYLSRYRALGKKLEIERLRISEMMNEDFEKPLDKQRITQDQFRDKCNELLIELNELEELLF
jgi:diphthamide biosynthesis methyltransferase